MRITDHEQNPILSTCLAWFGGGKRKLGPTKEENQAAKAEQASMQQAAANQAAAQQAQIDLARQQADDQRKAQEEMMRQMDANKPAPAAVVEQGDPQEDIRRQVAKRRGMQKSILAGESGQAPMATGYSTLG